MEESGDLITEYEDIVDPGPGPHHHVHAHQQAEHDRDEKHRVYEQQSVPCRDGFSNVRLEAYTLRKKKNHFSMFNI